MLNMGIANVSPPPPSAGPTVRVCRYVMDFDVVFESVCETSMRHKTLRPYVITWEKAQKAAFFSNISGFRMRVHHFETSSPVIKGAPLFHSSISNLHLHKQARIQVFWGCSDPPPPTAVCNIFFYIQTHR